MPETPDDPSPNQPTAAPGEPSEPTAPTGSSSVPAPVHELEVDLAGFLPEGSSLGDPHPDPAPDIDIDEDINIDIDIDEASRHDVATGAGRPADIEGQAGEGEVGEGGTPDQVVDTQPVSHQSAPRPGTAESVDLEALTQIEADLAAVDRALAALDDGSYGRCDACGELIEPERLRTDPVGRQCGRHLEPATS